MAEAIRTLAGVTADTFRHLQLGAGALLVDFDYGNITTPQAFREAFSGALRGGQSLGGTSGGIGIDITPEFRKIEIDGANVPFKGDSVIDTWTCQMSTTLKEFTPTILQAAFPTSEFAEIGDAITAMRIRTGIGESDYYENITWVATTQYGWIMVCMFNALGRTTGAISSEDKGEGDIPFEVVGHIEDFDDIDFAPCEIWLVDNVGGIIRQNVGTGGTG